jgi:rubrerythrin
MTAYPKASGKMRCKQFFQHLKEILNLEEVNPIMFNSYDNTYMGYGMTLVKDIKKAIDGEYHAIACYERLSQAAPSDEEQKRIQEIRGDEIRHFRTFSQIYTSLTGLAPTPQITEGCPTKYGEGLRASFKDEQETSDFYRRIAAEVDEPYIAEQFRRASADEQNHAVWFSFYYCNCCQK